MRPRRSGSSPSIVSCSSWRTPRAPAERLTPIFVDDLDALVADIASRGIEPDELVTYPGKARKAIYRDTDGNETGFGGASPEGD
jgi:hypothetical protein